MRVQPHLLFRDMPDPTASKRNPIPKLSGHKRKVIDVDALVAALDLGESSVEALALVEDLKSQTAVTKRKVVRALADKVERLAKDQAQDESESMLLRCIVHPDVREWCRLCGNPRGWAAVAAACILSKSTCSA